MIDYFNIGIIVNTHGIKGEVKILPTTDDPKRFESLDYVTIENRGKILEYHIKSIKYFKKFVIIKFEEVNDMNEAESLKQSTIKIPRELALPLEEDENYICDLIGLTVKTIEGTELGTVKDILFTGSNDVYIVEAQNKKEILIPAIKQCVKEINIKDKCITVELLEGLMD